MENIRLGRTNLMVSRTAFGALPIQRVRVDEAARLLRKAYHAGINFFDTARAYSDSEEKIGSALSDVRQGIVLATKTHAKNKAQLFQDLTTSLEKLKTDYVDILQLHNPQQLPDPDDPAGLYQALIEAQTKGLVRFIGISNHRLNVALEAAMSNLFDTIQFPLSSLSADKDLHLIEVCQQHDVGLIAMKALSGGLITNAAPTFAFLRQYKNVVPIWGIQREAELDEFLALEKNPPILDEAMWGVIETDRAELAGAFCRGCGYCLPCPADIPINLAARMPLLLQRMPYQRFLEDEWKAKMEGIEQCTECGQCRTRCPYELDPPSLLKHALTYYREFYATHVKEFT